MNILTLGDFYVSDFLKKEEDLCGKRKYPLNLVLDESIGAVKLTEAPPHSQMWGKYWYRSGTNISMKKELSSIVDEIVSRKKLSAGDLWLDIACNDGTLLSYVPEGIEKLGIDPAEDSFTKESRKHAEIIQDFFSVNSFNKSSFKGQKAKVVTTIAMFYDLENPDIFIQDIKTIIDDDGLWVVQLSYTPLMIEQMAFDNICHEHFYYYSLKSLKTLMSRNGMKIVDANLNDANGGSLRIYIQKNEASIQSFASAPMRDVCSFRVNALINYEETKCDISDPKVWEEFNLKIKNLQKEVFNFIEQEKSKGKIICGYGASTKGNTLLQLFGLNYSHIDCIAERSPRKYGLKTVETNIPIVSEEEMRQKNPDYLLVLPWHFIDEFVSREKEFLDRGGKFIIPCPKFEIIGK